MPANESLEASRLERCSTAHPMHRPTETILERIGTESFEMKASPTGSRRVWTLLLI
jgi:hypothetical protein